MVFGLLGNSAFLTHHREHNYPAGGMGNGGKVQGLFAASFSKIGWKKRIVQSYDLIFLMKDQMLMRIVSSSLRDVKLEGRLYYVHVAES